VFEICLAAAPKEKGIFVCIGVPGLKEHETASSPPSGVKTRLMRNA
jgi:hypothetical protein